MSSDVELVVYHALREAQSKYTYFLLAAAGAAIGFSLTQTNGLSITWSQVPLAFAVFAWGASFYMGCRHLVHVNSALYANAEMLKYQAELFGHFPQRAQAAAEEMRSTIKKNSELAESHGGRQFSLLVAGAVLYIAWHVLEMYLRSQG